MKVLGEYPTLPENPYDLYRYVTDILDDYQAGITHLSTDEYISLMDLLKGLDEDGIGL